MSTFSHVADENLSVYVQSDDPCYQRERKMRKNYVRGHPDERKEGSAYDGTNQRVPSFNGNTVDNEGTKHYVR